MTAPPSTPGRDALSGKRILLGVSGGIAVYKAAELARLLVKRGAVVSVVMTEAAQRFVTPLTFEALTGNPVGTALWETRGQGERREIHHTEAGRHADCIVIAPATADFIARMAAGLAGDLLGSILLASRAPVLVCPSMNMEMLAHPATQRNLATVSGFAGHVVLEPAAGELACGVVGPGRLPEPTEIVHHIARLLSPQDLAGRRLLISAGATREYFDPVRFLSNPSTGRMGFALAEAAWLRGALVTLVCGHTELTPPEFVPAVRVDSAAEMAEAVRARIPASDALIMAAAVSDWTATEKAPQKQKKRGSTSTLELVATEDILHATQHMGPAVRVGFAAETDAVVEHALEKMARKGLHAIVANRVSGTELSTGFGSATNAGILLRADRELPQELPLESKLGFAHRVLDVVAELLAARGAPR